MTAVTPAEDRVQAMAEARRLLLTRIDTRPPQYTIAVSADEPCRECGLYPWRDAFGPATLADCERWLDS